MPHFSQKETPKQQHFLTWNYDHDIGTFKVLVGKIDTHQHLITELIRNNTMHNEH